jgi:uncharacterized coiled-coil protein SlyX
MPEFRAPRVRLPKFSLPGRAGGASTKQPTASKAKTKEQPKAGNGTNPTAPKEAAKPAPGKAAGATKGKTPDPNLQERMEGLQGWMAEIERRQGRITYFGLAGLAIAILAAGGALYVGLTAKSDSATKSDLDGLTKRIDSLETAAAKNSKDTQAALNASVAQLQQSIASLQKQQSQNSANIATLQSQAASGALGKGAGAAAGTASTPGATTTTPNGK